MSGHTPGPWTATPRSSVVGQAVMAGDTLIAAVMSGEDNARLIAAAPDLLEAASALVAEADKINATVKAKGLGLSEPKTVQALRAAIAKASR